MPHPKIAYHEELAKKAEANGDFVEYQKQLQQREYYVRENPPYNKRQMDTEGKRYTPRAMGEKAHGKGNKRNYESGHRLDKNKGHEAETASESAYKD
jgi:hypothetical protein